ncbi:MAG TPA: hypothetical protein VLM37_13075 [Fibrobacteraceae bacterium]|nr:hypothetical protein [Fibrobacteraceae bacterium]
MNLALCEYLMAKDEAGLTRFATDMKEARAQMQSDQEFEANLGIELSKGGIRGDEAKTQSPLQIKLHEVKVLVQKLVLNSGTSSSNIRKPPVQAFAAIRGADQSQIAEIAHLVYWHEL